MTRNLVAQTDGELEPVLKAVSQTGVIFPTDLPDPASPGLCTLQAAAAPPRSCPVPSCPAPPPSPSAHPGRGRPPWLIPRPLLQRSPRLAPELLEGRRPGRSVERKTWGLSSSSFSASENNRGQSHDTNKAPPPQVRVT